MQTDPELISYMEPLALSSKMMTWSDMAVAHLSMPYSSLSKPADDGSIYEVKIFESKGQDRSLLEGSLHPNCCLATRAKAEGAPNKHAMLDHCARGIYGCGSSTRC